MRSDDQQGTAREADSNRQRLRRWREAKAVQLIQGQASGNGDESGKGGRGAEANGGVEERRQYKHGIDTAGIKSGRGLTDSLGRFRIRRATLPHVGVSSAHYEERLLKTRTKRRSRRWNSSRANNSSRRLKSGPRVGVKYSSV